MEFAFESIGYATFQKVTSPRNRQIGTKCFTSNTLFQKKPRCVYG